MLPRLLVVGVGSIGERHVRCFQQTGRVTIGICETNTELAHTIAHRYQISAIHHDLQAALREAYDAVLIATPADLHIVMAHAAVQAGKHVFLEKPLSTSLEGVDGLIDATRQQGVAACVGYVLRSHPLLAALRHALHSGRFGAPRHLYSTVGQHFPTYRPAYRHTYYRAHSTGGGAIQDALTHVLNAAEWLVGPIDRLIADAAHLALDGVDVEDTVNVVARHGAVLAGHCYNQHQAPNECTITVVCARGTLRFENHAHRWGWMVEPGHVWQWETSPELERDTLFVAQANHFLDVMAGRAAPLCSLSDAKQTLCVNLAALESLVHAAKWTVVPTPPSSPSTEVTTHVVR